MPLCGGWGGGVCVYERESERERERFGGGRERSCPGFILNDHL